MQTMGRLSFSLLDSKLLIQACRLWMNFIRIIREKASIHNDAVSCSTHPQLARSRPCTAPILCACVVALIDPHPPNEATRVKYPVCSDDRVRIERRAWLRLLRSFGASSVEQTGCLNSYGSLDLCPFVNACDMCLCLMPELTAPGAIYSRTPLSEASKLLRSSDNRHCSSLPVQAYLRPSELQRICVAVNIGLKMNALRRCS